MTTKGLTFLARSVASLLLMTCTHAIPAAPRAMATGSQHAQPGMAPPTAPANSVHIEVENTLFHPIDGVVLRVQRMNGRMVAPAGQLISLDDRNSFSIEIDQAVTRLSAANISSLLNSYLLRRAHSAIEHVQVSFHGQQVVLKGEVHKFVTLPFEGRGVLTATPEGDLRLHVSEFRVAGVLNEKFLEFLGVRLDNVAKSQASHSYRVEGDDFIAPLSALFPPPLVTGHLTGVHIEKQDMVQVIGVPFTDEHPGHEAIKEIPKDLPAPANYIYFLGGRMRFGKMTMDNVDLQLVDRNAHTPFDFSLDHYEQQIQAGYVKVMPSLGLVVYAADYSEVQQRKR
jgi:hypothetical protein